VITVRLFLFAPKYSSPYNNLAWLLATCSEASIRNGKRAVELALKACELTECKKWYYIGTLGAAYAEVGDFTQAIKYQTQALNMENVSEKDRTAAQQRLNLYQQGKPYHENPQ
jgi:tetratricopeptide (TPR) repeat protein